MVSETFEEWFGIEKRAIQCLDIVTQDIIVAYCSDTWNHQQSKLDKANKRIEKLRDFHESISKNTCCKKCQEASLVSKAALEADDKARGE